MKKSNESRAVPGGSGHGKAAIKHIIRERYDDAFITHIPQNVIFGAEDGTFSIKAISHRKPRNPNASPEEPIFHSASLLYYKIVSNVERLFTTTDVMCYYLAFDIPEYVPTNKSFEQDSRRNGKDTSMDSRDVAKVEWPGVGVYLRPHTQLKDWERVHGHSGRALFRQAVSDVFCMLMEHYTPPLGKTLLISGMLSHPSKKDPDTLKTCTKVYFLHTPWRDGIDANATKITPLKDENGEIVLDDEGLPVTDPASLPVGHIPHMGEQDPDIPTPYQFDLDDVPMEHRLTYMPRLHKHMRQHRQCVPGLKIMIGEAEMAIFYMLQLIAGNVSTCDDIGSNPNIARSWLLDALGESFPESLDGADWRHHGEAPGIILKSKDTDIICLSLAASTYLEQSNKQTAKRGGWHYSGPPNEGVYWVDPTFKLSIYLDMCARKIEETEVMEMVRKTLQIFELDDNDSQKNGGQYSKGHLDEVAKSTASTIMKQSGRVDRFSKVKVYTEDIMIVPLVYTKLLQDLNRKETLVMSKSKIMEFKGFIQTPIHTFVTAVKAFGDDYVLPFIPGIPMGWFTNAVFSFGANCNVISIEPYYFSNISEDIEAVRLALHIRDASIDPEDYMNLIKGAIIECYSKKDVLPANLHPLQTTMKELWDAVKGSSKWAVLPKAPFYTARGLRLLWTVIYNFVGQISPHHIPNPLYMGWDLGLEGESYLVPHIDEGSFDKEYLAKKENSKIKAANTRKAKKEAANANTIKRILLPISMEDEEIL